MRSAAVITCSVPTSRDPMTSDALVFCWRVLLAFVSDHVTSPISPIIWFRSHLSRTDTWEGGCSCQTFAPFRTQPISLEVTDGNGILPVTCHFPLGKLVLSPMGFPHHDIFPLYRLNLEGKETKGAKNVSTLGVLRSNLRLAHAQSRFRSFYAQPLKYCSITVWVSIIILRDKIA